MAKRLLVFQHTHWEGPGKFLLGAAEKYSVSLEIRPRLFLFLRSAP